MGEFVEFFYLWDKEKPTEMLDERMKNTIPSHPLSMVPELILGSRYKLWRVAVHNKRGIICIDDCEVSELDVQLTETVFNRNRLEQKVDRSIGNNFSNFIRWFI